MAINLPHEGPRSTLSRPRGPNWCTQSASSFCGEKMSASGTPPASDIGGGCLRQDDAHLASLSPQASHTPTYVAAQNSAAYCPILKISAARPISLSADAISQNRKG